MLIKRSAGQYLSYLSEHFPVVVLTGARQTEKSMLIKEFANEKGGMTLVSMFRPTLSAISGNLSKLGMNGSFCSFFRALFCPLGNNSITVAINSQVYIQSL